MLCTTAKDRHFKVSFSYTKITTTHSSCLGINRTCLGGASGLSNFYNEKAYSCHWNISAVMSSSRDKAQ